MSIQEVLSEVRVEESCKKVMISGPDSLPDSELNSAVLFTTGLDQDRDKKKGLGVTTTNDSGTLVITARNYMETTGREEMSQRAFHAISETSQERQITSAQPILTKE